MILDAGSRFLVARHDLRSVRIAPDSDAPAARPLAEGEARLAVAHFALTANNITYAAFGEAMKYWQFFPCGDAAWGCIPVWGFATVVESRADGVAVGRRVYGYLPMGTHLVVQPARVGAGGFVDAAPHRAELAAVYNQLHFCDADPGYDAAQEGQQAVLRPLFATAFLIDDFLADNAFFGARQVLLSSASSKTAYGTAFCLARRQGGATVLGLTSPGNLDFTASLGCYGRVLRYDALATLDPAVPTVFVDFAGDAALRRRIHTHFDGTLAYSCSVGGTHWDGLGGAGGLPGPRPTLFFAPAQIKKRSGPPPDGWGPGELQRRLADAWTAFMQPVNDPEHPWLRIRAAQGATAVEAAYRALLDGPTDARDGLMLRL
ncbi:DUF2855 family protein [Rubrivivax sp. RP6-9]|uniref:DUF2855 family protein n=1 Tax=Rubrivivax sp. RP6-9 TaxID=3415750 RepID=UPI003CC6958A